MKFFLTFICKRNLIQSSTTSNIFSEHTNIFYWQRINLIKRKYGMDIQSLHKKCYLKNVNT